MDARLGFILIGLIAAVYGDECEDAARESKMGYCKIWLKSGVCESYKKEMKLYCPKTCGFCGAGVEEKPAPKDDALYSDSGECKDAEEETKLGLCKQWVEDGLCEEHKDEVGYLCPKSCGFCGEEKKDIPSPKVHSFYSDSRTKKNAVPFSKTGLPYSDSGRFSPFSGNSGECKDAEQETKLGLCKRWVEDGLCEEHKDEVGYLCPKSCGFCGEEKKDIPAPKVDATYSDSDECKDAEQETRLGLCKRWVEDGLCEEHKEEVGYLCPKSCGFCGEKKRDIPVLKPFSDECKDAEQETKLGLCKRWVEDGLCEEHRDEVGYLCPKSCGFCGEKKRDVPAPKDFSDECKDAEQETKLGLCKRWVDDGLCEEHRDEVGYLCPKSCGFCGEKKRDIPAPKADSDECKDAEQETKLGLCKQWVEAGLCEEHRDEVGFLCPKSCGFCGEKKRDSPALKADSDECKDAEQETKLGLCKRWVADGLCEEHRDEVGYLCPKSCGFCGEKKRDEPAPKANSDECKDAEQETRLGLCKRWVADGLCEEHRDEVGYLCPKSCGFCGEKKRDELAPKADSGFGESCNDWLHDCDRLARLGNCISQPKIMQKNCCKSCKKYNTTGSHPHPKCADWLSNCKEMAKNGSCESEPEFMKENCCLACKLHNATDECKDSEREASKGLCKEWADAGLCTEQSKAMKKYCPKTCGFCGAGSKNVTFPKANVTYADSGECKDAEDETKLGLCKLWSEGGLCYSHKDEVGFLCPKSCGFCGEEKKDILNNDECKDAEQETKLGLCKRWVEADLCESHKDEVGFLCPKSCGYCGTKRDNVAAPKKKVAYTDSDECQDSARESAAGYCKLWAEGGYCESHKEEMTLYCPKSCGFCGSEAPKKDFVYSDPNECKDAERESAAGYCKQWKEVGFCESHKEEMTLYCPQTCGLCGAKDEVVPAKLRSKRNIIPALMKVLSYADSNECKDRERESAAGYCKRWLEGEFCVSHKKEMAIYCPKTCGLCGAEEEKIPALRDVLFYAKSRSERHTLLDQKKNLAYSDSDECKDAERESSAGYCTDWKSVGFCELHKEEMTMYCPQTCGFCGAKDEVIPAKSRSKRDAILDSKNEVVDSNADECKDAERESAAGYCKDWKSVGFCESHKEEMTLYCPETCGLCGAKDEVAPAQKDEIFYAQLRQWGGSMFAVPPKCSQPDDSRCGKFEARKDFYCQHIWTKTFCKHMCDVCESEGSGDY